MGLFGQKTTVATLEIDFFEGDRARVVTWTMPADRQEEAYHTVLLFLMYYARVLFFLSFRETADELVGRMGKAVETVAAAGEGLVDLGLGWELVKDAPESPRVTWSATLTSSGPGQYRCRDSKPNDTRDADAQMSVLLTMQHLMDTLQPVERAYVALGIAGMHEYYDTGLHWHTTKALHPAPAYGIAYARKILERKSG